VYVTASFAHAIFLVASGVPPLAVKPIGDGHRNSYAFDSERVALLRRAYREAQDALKADTTAAK
jgi:hypothetical protein